MIFENIANLMRLERVCLVKEIDNITAALLALLYKMQ